ncbi:MAG: c-type cytochrome [Chitinophagales bacterium]
MKKFLVLIAFITGVMIFVSFVTPGTGRMNMVSPNDSLEKDRAKFSALVSESIKGKEKMAVDSVFSNLKVLGDFPAGNLVLAMNAWSRGLGVSCGHCHNTDNFASDEKQTKEIARQMVSMGNMISEKLRTINGLSERPIVNCITCHRGELKPAFRMPENK